MKSRRPKVNTGIIYQPIYKQRGDNKIHTSPTYISTSKKKSLVFSKFTKAPLSCFACKLQLSLHHILCQDHGFDLERNC